MGHDTHTQPFPLRLGAPSAAGVRLVLSGEPDAHDISREKGQGATDADREDPRLGARPSGVIPPESKRPRASGGSSAVEQWATNPVRGTIATRNGPKVTGSNPVRPVYRVG